MFLVSSNDNMFQQTLVSSLVQKNIQITTQISEPCFAQIDYLIRDSELEIQVKEKVIKLPKPCRFDDVFSQTMILLSGLFITIDQCSYSPIKQNVTFKNKTSKLNDIHNKIFTSLILHLQKGIEKNILYRKIWPKDKEIQINKLDTHLTNIKNKLTKELNYKFKIITAAGKIKLIIN